MSIIEMCVNQRAHINNGEALVMKAGGVQTIKGIVAISAGRRAAPKKKKKKSQSIT